MMAEPVKGGNPGFKAGLGQRTKVERLGWAWKGAKRNAVEKRFNALQAVSEARSEVDKLTGKLRKAEQGPDKADVRAVLIFAQKDNVGKLAGYEFFSPDDPSADSADLEALRGHLLHVPVGLVMVLLDRENKKLIVHARPWILEHPALKLLEDMVEKAADLKDWWIN